MPDHVGELADAVWDFLTERGAVDSRGGIEYERRINALRAWLWDAEGCAPERCPSMYPYTEFGPGTQCALPANHLGQLHRSAPLGFNAFLWL